MMSQHRIRANAIPSGLAAGGGLLPCRAVQRVVAKKLIAAPRQAVWDLYADHVSWSRWAGLGKVSLERIGDPAPNGVGCVRVISRAGFKVREEVDVALSEQWDEDPLLHHAAAADALDDSALVFVADGG